MLENNTEKIGVDLDKIDISILYYLYTNDAMSAMYSAQINGIQSYFKEKPLSYYTIVRRTKKLLDKAYVSEGYKLKNAKTYYITDKGVNFIESQIIEKDENVYESVEEKIRNQIIGKNENIYETLENKGEEE